MQRTVSQGLEPLSRPRTPAALPAQPAPRNRMRSGWTWAGLLIWGAFALACGSPTVESPASPQAAAPPWPTGPRPHAHMTIEGLGELTIELYPEWAPETVDNFIRLAQQGFYDGTRFHRVIPDFMIQGGDPLSRDKDPRNDGQGGPGYTVPDEFSDAPHRRGVLSMANEGRPDSGGSQFFILQRDAPHLDGQHAVFGRVIEGLEVVDTIASLDTDIAGRWGPRDQPLQPVVVKSIRIENAQDTADATPKPVATPS